jgi:tetratricopeptide (TPR) repeat protein
VRLYFSRVRVAYWVFMPLQGVNRAGRAYIPFAFAVLSWFALQAVRTALQYGVGGMQIAYSVHVGGFAAGALLALCFRALGEARAEKHLVKARRHFEKASWFAAQAEYAEYLGLKPLDAEAHAELARACICGGDTGQARPHYVDAVRLHMDAGERAAAETLFGGAIRQVPNFALPEELHLDLACGMERTLKFQSAMRAYEHFVWRYPSSGEAPFVLLRMAGLLEKRLGRPEEAYECYRRLTREYPSDHWAEHARSEVTRFERARPSDSFAGKK